MLLGCIADDFTGAGDAASFLEQGGMKTLLVSGVPRKKIPEGAQAVVVALKSRTQDREAAVADSLAALKWLKEQGAEHFYVKYCSTFDSTLEGNIGPICDAALEFCGGKYTLLCPSLPVNGRTVREGVLYVHGVPLSESHMKNHPLTPMHESHLTKLMEPQSRYAAGLLPKGAVAEEDGWLKDENVRYYVPDYETEADGETIISRFGSLPLLTGGSGLLTPWARYLLEGKGSRGKGFGGSQGRAILLAGSCSKATLGQIEHFRAGGGRCYKLDPAEILAGRQTMAQVEAAVESAGEEPLLVYASETPEYLEAIRGELLTRYADILEQTLARTAVAAREKGIRHIIVAGGETSGAVTKALGYSSYWLGPAIAPGVPMLIPPEDEEIRLVLKSGNFGQEDFFERALQETGLKEA